MIFARVSGQWNYHPVSGEALSLKTSEVIAELKALSVEAENIPTALDNVRELAEHVRKFWKLEQERLRTEKNG